MTTTEYRTKGDVTVRYVDGTEDGIDFDAAYRVDGYSGVAWRLQGWKQERPAFDSEDFDDEWEDDLDFVVAVMVGDDRFFLFDRDEVHVIDEDDFCHSCGQIGCGHDGRDRD